MNARVAWALALVVALVALPRAVGAQDLAGLRVCIDPGHGGQSYSKSWTGGFVGPNDLTESKATLDIALLLREEFRRAGAEVVLTRTKDQRVTPEGTTAEEELDARVRIAQEAGAQFLLSIHLSSSTTDATLNATRVFHHGAHEDVEKLFGEAIGRSVSSALGTTFRGPQAYANRVVAQAEMPALLIEVSSLSNPGEAARLARLSYAKRAAEAIFRGFTIAHRHVPDDLLPASPAPVASSEAPPPPRVARPPSAAPVADASTPRSPVEPTTDESEPNAEPSVPSEQARTSAEDGTSDRFVPFVPLLANPVAGELDQAWLYGERYATLPLQTGVCYQVPEDSIVTAAAAGVVETVVPFGELRTFGLPNDVASYEGMVIIRHDDVKLEGKAVWTVYARMPEIFVAPGEIVAAGEVLGKTGRPYDGTPASRASAFLFEVRVGHNSSLKTVNPSLLVARPPGAEPRGWLALLIVGADGLPLEAVEVRGIEKRLPRYGYSLTYSRGANPHPEFHENIVIGDVPPGRYTLTAGDHRVGVEVRAGTITRGRWTLRDR